MKHGSQGEKMSAALHYVLEKKGIIRDERKLLRIYIIEIKIVSLSSLGRVMEKKGD